MGASAIAEGTTTQAASTIGTWPAPVKSDNTTGSIDYAIGHPTTFIASNDKTNDWYYSEDGSADKSRWGSKKTIYDPCPPGYRVPDGGDEGVWVKASGGGVIEEEMDEDKSGYDITQFSDSAPVCWYPLTFGLQSGNGSLKLIGETSTYLSCTTAEDKAYCLTLSRFLLIEMWFGADRSDGHSVRCMKEHSGGTPSVDPEISVTQPEAYSEKGGDFSIAYSIKNPKEGAKLEASTEDGWITGLAADGKQISFSLTANDTGKERTGQEA